MSLWSDYIAGGGVRPPKRAPKSSSSDIKDALYEQLAQQLGPDIGGGMTGVGVPDVPDIAGALEAASSNVVPFPTGGGRSSGGVMSGGGGGGGGGAGAKTSSSSTTTAGADWMSLVWLGVAIVGFAAAGSLVIRFVRG